MIDQGLRGLRLLDLSARRARIRSGPNNDPVLNKIQPKVLGVDFFAENLVPTHPLTHTEVWSSALDELIGQVQRISRVAPFSLPHLTTTATR